MTRHRFWTLKTSPIAIRFVTSDEPAYEKNGSGIPVTGIRPIHIPIFSKMCAININATPTQM